MTTLLAWVWAPIALYLLLLGLGLLADRLLAAEVPGSLLAPLGLGVAIVLTTPVYRFGLAATVALPLIAVAAGAGFFLARGHLRRRGWQPTALGAAAVVYGLHMLPVALSGEATWAGYNFVNDTAANFVLIDLLEHHGATAPTDGSTTSRVSGYFATSGYPIGAHGMVATIRPLAGAPIEAIYQPVLALVAALTAMSLTEICRRAGLRPLGAAAAGVLAMGAVLFYRYAQHGAIKEVVLTALCATAAALAVVALDRRLPIRLVVLVAVCCMAMVFAFSAAAGAYALALGVAVLLAAVMASEGPDWRHLRRLGAASAGIALVALIPMLGSTLDFARIVTDVFSSSSPNAQDAFGHLLRPLPITEGAGVWLGRDYRLEVETAYDELNTVLVAAAIVTAVAGLALCVVRRVRAPLILLGVVALPAAALAPFASPYIDAKLMVTLTPAVVLLAAFAAISLVQHASLQVRAVGAVALTLVAAGVLTSDLFAYRESKLAPIERMNAMEDAAANIPGDGLWLFNEWEEFGKYFMRSARINAASERDSLKRVRFARPITYTFGRWFDLDVQRLSYVNGFAGVITRRSPEASRPPSSFRSIYRNRYYEVWKRDPSVHIREHVGFQSPYRASFPATCGTVDRLARLASPKDRLVAARPARVASLSPFLAQLPPAWTPAPLATPGTVRPTGAGVMRATLTAANDGGHLVWVSVSSGRKLTVSVDGRRVGDVSGINTPGQWLSTGPVTLRAGPHRVELRRAAASLGPGDAFRGELGPVALQAIDAPKLVTAAPRDARRLCGKTWDWIELVRG